MRYGEIISEASQPIIAYHGGGSLHSFDPTKARSPNDYFGGGIAYFTDDYEIARSYARATEKRTGEGWIYKVELDLDNTFDVSETFSGDKLIELLPKDVEAFARGAGLMRAGVDKYRVLAQLNSGRMELTGYKVFKGLSKGMVNTTKAREHLKKHGYDSLRYTGGLNMGGETHNVWLPYYDHQVTILSSEAL